MKKWFQSKTIWANLLAAVLAMLALVDSNLLTAIGIEDKTKYLAIVGTVTTAVNILLRVVTNKAIDTTASK
ncbi:hypothetical protein F0919_17835 [Taibaiella lutea]|uniref:Holin n=1 Tax=Taibaiella lutea TaxID=2608001 RepID=A0A5M6CFE7_9BACT|nr:hypothetical protein [Taibaiella lutea]KAA5532642.1 hypothetical protein F0919_17835 [Taibaiella lutea]